MCYHAEFGRSMLKGIGVNTGELPKLASPGTLLSWDGGVADPKIHTPHGLPRQIW